MADEHVFENDASKNDALKNDAPADHVSASEGSANDERFFRLQRLLLDAADINQFLTRLAQLAAEVVTADLSCGITLRYDANLLTVGSSDARAELLDETQYRFGGGPCLQSVQTGQIVDLPDTRLERRWQPYLAEAVHSGMRCSLSMPLTLDGDTFGALNVYGFAQPNMFGPDHRRRLELFAAQAAGTLRVGARQAKDTAVFAQMEESLRSRSSIDQALGIIMATQRCSATQAFDLLRRQSQNSHTRLRDIAEDLITRTTGALPEPGRPFGSS